MGDWRDRPEIDDMTVSTLISAVGTDAFVAMRQQFIDDLQGLARSYREAAANCNEAEARATAHALKGAAANIGLQRLSALAACLEGGQTGPAEDLDSVLSRSIIRLEDAA